jgi:hypothetical protein
MRDGKMKPMTKKINIFTVESLARHLDKNANYIQQVLASGKTTWNGYQFFKMSDRFWIAVDEKEASAIEIHPSPPREKTSKQAKGEKVPGDPGN